MSRILGTATALVGIAVLALSAAPATAATLPVTDTVYILPCDDLEFNGILYTMDTTTGVATQVGSWVNPDTDVFSCAGPGAYNPVNGKGYWISWGAVDNLIEVDLATGVNTLIAEFTLSGLPYSGPVSLAIDSAGNAWAASYEFGFDMLFSVNLATAELTEVGPTGVIPSSESYGLAWDSVTDTVYGYNVSNQDFYEVNTATGAFTLFNDDVFGANTPYAIAFDSAGQVWGVDQDIISAPLADLDNFEELVVINERPVFGGTIYSESIIIAPAAAPVLAATGSDNSSAGILAGAGALLVVAGIVIARRRKTA